MTLDLIKHTQQQFEIAIGGLKFPPQEASFKSQLKLAETCLRIVASTGNDELELEMATTLAPFKCRELCLEIEALTEVSLWKKAGRKLAILNLTCREPQLDYGTLTDCQFWQGIAIQQVERKLGEFFATGGVSIETHNFTEVFADLVHFCNLLVLCNSQAQTLVDSFESQVSRFKAQFDLTAATVLEKDRAQIARLAGELLDEEGSSHSASLLAITKTATA